MSDDHIPPIDTGHAEADDLLLDALLLRVFEPNAAAERETRIVRAMEQLRSLRTPAPSHLSNRRWLRPASAVAALLILCLSLLPLLMPASSAKASTLQQMLDSLTEGDRTYALQVEPPEDPAPQHPSLDDATLYLRGSSQFVLMRHGPSGNDLFDGYDGHSAWRVRRGVVAESTAPSATSPSLPLPHIMGEIPLSDLHTTLQQLTTDYTLKTENSAGQLHMMATRGAWAKGPPTIEIWADVKSHVPRRILFDRAKFQGSPEARRLTLTLTSEANLPANWFAPAAHTTRIQ